MNKFIANTWSFQGNSKLIYLMQETSIMQCNTIDILTFSIKSGTLIKKVYFLYFTSIYKYKLNLYKNIYLGEFDIL